MSPKHSRPRIIMVVGLPRSGTSLTAGVVNRMGVPFFCARTTSNYHASGYYLDKDFDDAAFSSPTALDGILQRRAGLTWGVKGHGLKTPIFNRLITGRQVLFIEVVRSSAAIHKSLDRKRVKHGTLRGDKRKAIVRRRLGLCRQRINAMRAMARASNLPWLSLHYDRLIDQPSESVLSIAQFIEYKLSAQHMQDIFSFIRPELRHRC